ncbi:uncharacterized protein [Typha angustifolia]|uniref:uncharacterized protein n=1 Tax=Typha angustifolia TaxID=59011 RepID=UPI003C2C52DA
MASYEATVISTINEDEEESASRPGTPDRRSSVAASSKGYASDTEVRWLLSGGERRWRRRRKHVVLQAGHVCMDVEEVKACRDLGLGLPCDMRVQITCVDDTDGRDSPGDGWGISGPGDDPKEVKERLKTWAQAVALASASRLGS